ncbi:hypothetical protein IT774_14840 [Salinimonas marina]|uniref:Uncharacterized protein n=1 Tax=Salinimonas marina TaxID=2785918 RepID=A0A7S9DWU8_9ALTE|nr:hypothetical protein [Salinimonas marina]QPG05363.1 hypothetical protein IT774_14840 [Salinimonas marina]
MRFPTYGQYALDVSGNMLEVYATGAWTRATTEAAIEEIYALLPKFNQQPWGALLDGRRWVLTTPECQNRMAEAILHCIDHGLSRSAYVLDPGMVKRAQLERTYPNTTADYQRNYFQSYFAALNWLHTEGFCPYRVADPVADDIS